MVKRTGAEFLMHYKVFDKKEFSIAENAIFPLGTTPLISAKKEYTWKDIKFEKEEISIKMDII